MKNKGGMTIWLLAVHVLAISLVATLVLIGTAMGEIPRNGLVAEYFFDDDVKDSSGNGNHGTFYGATFVNGKFGKALSFDGVDGGVTVPDSNSIDISSTVSIIFWMKANANPPTAGGWGWLPLVLKANSGYITTWNYGVYYGYDNDQSIWVGFGDGTDSRTYNTQVNSISLNNWNYIAVIISPPSASVYINGVSQPLTDSARGGTASTMATNSEPLLIGGKEPEGAKVFNGLIDEVRIYNRALSAEEIKAIYEAGQIIITSSPSGAEVLMDESYKGTATPTLTVYGVAPGSHNVKCRLSGYSDYGANVILTAGSFASVNCILSLIPTVPTPSPTITTPPTVPTSSPTITTPPTVPTPSPTITTPILLTKPQLSVSQDPFSFNFGTMNAGDHSSQIFSISNSGGGTLIWAVSKDQPWITFNPTSGTDSGTVTININTVGMSPGSYSGIITVTSNGGTRKGSISLNIQAALTPTPISIPASISPIPAPSLGLVQIIGVILVLAGLLFTALTTVKKDISLEVGVSERTLKYVGGAGILLIIIGAYIILKSFGLM